MNIGNQLNKSGLHNVKRKQHKLGQKKYWTEMRAYLKKHPPLGPKPMPKEEIEQKQKQLRERAMNLNMGFRFSIKEFFTNAFRKH